MRKDGRARDALRPVEMIIGFQRTAAGSVLYRAGGTVVLCSASIDPKVPPFLEGKGKGWVTAEYQMHPRSNPPRREGREGRGNKAVSGRTQEIQRLIGRALRAAVKLETLGERQIVVDCDVLEADGGTRTASVTGGFVALALAVEKLRKAGLVKDGVFRECVAAVSAGIMKDGSSVLDLPYIEDSTAEVDLNLVATESGKIIEIQGTAEGEPVPRARIDELVELGTLGVSQLVKEQRRALEQAGVKVASLLAT